MIFTGEDKLKFYNRQVLIDQQEHYFNNIFGEYPDLNKKYKAPYRIDNDPGCRLKVKDDILYLVDNIKYKNKLYWNMFDIQKEMNLNITDKYTKKKKLKSNNKNEFQIIVYSTVKFNDENNPFKDIQLTPEQLNSDPETFLVTEYWANSTKNPKLIKNKYGDPKKEPVIAYIVSNKVKLYFLTRNKYKWFSTLTYEVFNQCYMNLYNDEYIVITKSKKDCLVLWFVFGIQCIAFQNEGIIPEDIDLSRFKKIFVLYDNDEAGKTAANALKNVYSNLTLLFYDKYKDTAEYIKNDFYELTKKMKQWRLLN